MSRPGPAPDPAWTSRAEGGAGTSRAGPLRIFPAELFRGEIARPLHPRSHGRAALVAAGPCAEPAWTSRAEGGAGTSRADALRIAPAELFRRETHVPYTLGDTGGPRLSRPGPAPSLLGRPAPRAARVLRAPTHRVSTRRNCSDVKSRVPCTLDHTGGPRLSRPGPAPGLLGRPAPRAARVLRAPTRCWFGDAGFHFGTAPA